MNFEVLQQFAEISKFQNDPEVNKHMGWKGGLLRLCWCSCVKKTNTGEIKENTSSHVDRCR